MLRPCFGIQNIYKLTGGHRGVPSPNIDIPSNTVNPVRCGANINLSVTYLRQICINKKNGILDFCFAFTEKKIGYRCNCNDPPKASNARSDYVN